MPYFIYRLMPFNMIEKIEQFDKFKDASNRAKEIRKEIPVNADYSIKVIFAENELAAEDILNTPREPGIMTGEDY
ncbi:MAG: hypothetical protein WBX11_08720 [Thiobacillaceae bacterium]|jgi:hypothetical protein